MGEMLTLLEKFRFKNKRLNIQVKDLSGGEKARLAIVSLMLKKSKALLFDEPTNHLDIPMKETLEMSIREFLGGVIIVSHDRFFLSQTCTSIFSFQFDTWQYYEGDYKTF